MIWLQTLLALLLLPGTTSSPSPPRGTRQLKKVSPPCCQQGVSWEIRHSPSVLIWAGLATKMNDSKPAVSPPAHHLCSTFDCHCSNYFMCARIAARSLRSARGSSRGTASSFILPALMGAVHHVILVFPRTTQNTSGGNYIVLSHFSAGS